MLEGDIARVTSGKETTGMSHKFIKQMVKKLVLTNKK